jgi:hypothetical protein
MIAATCALMTAAVLAYVFYFGGPTTAGAEKTRLDYLRERKEVVYENLRDLNFDYKAGKVPPSDYETMRAALEDEAVTVLAEIELLEAQQEQFA